MCFYIWRKAWMVNAKGHHGNNQPNFWLKLVIIEIIEYICALNSCCTISVNLIKWYQRSRCGRGWGGLAPATFYPCLRNFEVIDQKLSDKFEQTGFSMLFSARKSRPDCLRNIWPLPSLKTIESHEWYYNQIHRRKANMQQFIYG